MTDLETLEQIFEDYLDQRALEGNPLSVQEVVFFLEAMKFRVLYNNEMASRDEEDEC